MILVKAAPGVVIELSANPAGLLDQLRVKLADGLSPTPMTFEIRESRNGRLVARPAEGRELSELMLFVGALAANEGAILAEVRKYHPA